MDAVCFDMDGVLVDSEDYWVERERDHILPTVAPDEEIPPETVTGMFYEEMYDVLAADYDLAVDEARFLELYDEAATDIYGDRVALTEGTTDLLEALAERDVPVAMVTSSPPDWYGVVLERFDLGETFDAVVCAADLDGPGKPEPGIYERTAAKLGVDPASTLAVEDSGHGIESARRTGMTTLGFAAGDHEGAVEDADVVAETPAELREAVLSRVGAAG